ncbi:MAG: flagellar biosynthetic protein FliO [Myxococcota bacterium]|nr:flagellar biosynthetic protein FliO [Myxococcota bacterium]
MLRRFRLGRSLYPAVTAAVLAAATAWGQAAQPPSSAAHAAADAGSTVGVIPAPDPILDAQAEEAERLRKRQALEEVYGGDSELATQAEHDERSLGSVAFQTFLALGIVILMVYLTLNYGLRRMMGLRPVSGGGKVRLVDVVERVALDQKKSMYVVKAAGEYLLVGGSEGGLSLISRLDPEAVARLQAQAPARKPPAISPFLQKLLSRRDGTPPKAG